MIRRALNTSATNRISLSAAFSLATTATSRRRASSSATRTPPRASSHSSGPTASWPSRRSRRTQPLTAPTRFASADTRSRSSARHPWRPMPAATRRTPRSTGASSPTAPARSTSPKAATGPSTDCPVTTSTWAGRSIRRRSRAKERSGRRGWEDSRSEARTPFTARFWTPATDTSAASTAPLPSSGTARAAPTFPCLLWGG